MIRLWCVEDDTKVWKSLLLRRGLLYTASHVGEDGRPVILDLGEPAPQWFDMSRFRTTEELPQWAVERGRELREEWNFVCETLKKAGHPAPKDSLLHSGIYSQGFGWDCDDQDGVYREPQQTRRWDPETRQFVPGRDPSPYPLSGPMVDQDVGADLDTTAVPLDSLDFDPL